jgi:hypothetical protein
MFPFNDAGMVSGLICGTLFGFVLESAGFGSPAKLTAQFQLRDWSVFKVMFTAIVVAAVGLYGLQWIGYLRPDAVFVPSALLMASAVAGAMVGAGFAVGGYCPGTSVVGLFSGRIDALMFFIGLLLGTVVFAGLYGPVIESIMGMWELQTGDSFTTAFGVAEWQVLLVMIAALVLVFWGGTWFERRGLGTIDAAQAVQGSETMAASN